MIEPYTAVGLIPSFWGIRRREDIEKNLEHLESLTKAAFWLSNLDIPVRLVAIGCGVVFDHADEIGILRILVGGAISLIFEAHRHDCRNRLCALIDIVQEFRFAAGKLGDLFQMCEIRLQSDAGVIQ